MYAPPASEEGGTTLTEGRASRTPSRLAKAVRMERDRKGWTSERLADAGGVSHSWVRNFEAGIIQNPSAERIRALEQALELRVGELYAASTCSSPSGN